MRIITAQSLNSYGMPVNYLVEFYYDGGLGAAGNTVIWHALFINGKWLRTRKVRRNTKVWQHAYAVAYVNRWTPEGQ